MLILLPSISLFSVLLARNPNHNSSSKKSIFDGEFIWSGVMGLCVYVSVFCALYCYIYMINFLFS